MEVEIIMLNKTSQAQKDRYCMFLLYVEARSKEKMEVNIDWGIFARKNQKGVKRR
jgi:hypothetical protein